MKYASVDGEYTEAQRGLSGECKSCGSPAIAKCGKKKVWHWAHKGKRMCDPWWENETDWHRAWKAHFPKELQEVTQYAENSEKHIADVKLDQGYVLEFQHSDIKPEEKHARESFYKKMIWIVHGTRRKTDKEKFDIMMWHSKPVDVKENERSIPSYIKKRGLLYEWGDSSVPVFFDFDDDILWCLWPKICVDSTYIFKIERNFLITALQARQEDNSFEKILKHWLSAIEINEWRKKKQDLQKRCIFP